MMLLSGMSCPIVPNIFPTLGSHQVCLKIALMKIGIWNLIAVEMGFILGFLGKRETKKGLNKKGIKKIS